jgi:hypothetical protein
VYLLKRIKTSESVRNQVAGRFALYPSISDNIAWKRKPPLCHPDPDSCQVAMDSTAKKLLWTNLAEFGEGSSHQP